MTNCEKEQALKNYFSQKKSVLIAFSGGVDSSLLAALAAGASAESSIESLAVTLKTELISDEEVENAVLAAKEIGIKHIIIEKSVLNIPEIRFNRPNRCYVCKKEMFQTLLKFAEDNDYETVIEGTNYSDIDIKNNDRPQMTQNKLRPGFSALLELSEIQKKRGENLPRIETPLADLKIKKAEIREIAQRRKLISADKPSMSCLATRFSYDETLTAEMIQTIGIAENRLREIGLSQIRIRCHVDSKQRRIARIEIEKNEINLISKTGNGEKIESLISFLKQNGFSYVTVDLEGFRSGSMDENGKENDGGGQ